MFKKLSNLHTDDKGYANGWEHISDELKRLDLRIQLLLLRNRPARQPDSAFEQLKGLVVSEEEVCRLLNDQGPALHGGTETGAAQKRLAGMERCIRERLRLSREKGVFLPLPYLAGTFNLSFFEEQCIVICLAIEIDRKYEKLYAFLQDDITCKNPTVDLAMKLLCKTPEEKLAARLSFAPGGRLHKFFLKKQGDDPEASLLVKALKLDDRILRFLLDSEQVDESICSFTEVFIPGDDLAPLLLGGTVQEKIKHFLGRSASRESKEKRKYVFYLYGPSGSGKKLQVKNLCNHFNLPVMIIDLRVVLGSEQAFGELTEKAVREAILHRAVLCFQNLHVLSEDQQSQRNMKKLLEILSIFSGILFFLADHLWKPVGLTKEYFFIEIELGIPQDFERKKLWEFFGSNFSISTDVDWGAMAGKFRFTPGQIQNALETARNITAWHSGENRQMIREEELNRACYAQVHHDLGKKATRIQPLYGWEDIILPPEQKKQLRNACNQMKYRHIVYGEWGFDRKLSYGKGLCMLFSGPPGTGKTMSAQVVARELYLELYKIDLSQVVSKYIGETEKNLQQIFREAQLSNAILFFDETDALFGKRSEVKDSHDRYANIETAFLLQKIEEYEGITVLATNFSKNIDEAFMRRFNFIIEFPFPDAGYRKEIWRLIFPREAPVSPDIDFEFIANKFEVAGGNIKNIAVAAAFLAAEASEAIGMKHVLLAAKYEFDKMGKVLLKEELGEYYHIIGG